MIETTDAAADSSTTYEISGNGGVFRGNIEYADDSDHDVDWVKVQLEAGKTYTFEVTGYCSIYGYRRRSGRCVT